MSDDTRATIWPASDLAEVWIDPEDNAVIMQRGDEDCIELRTFDEPRAAYRFAVDFETFLRARWVEVELEGT